MAHIPDGVLSLPVLLGGGVLAVAGIAIGLRRLDERDIPKAALTASVFFVASLVSIPIGPSSIHLLLGGLMGLILGVGAFPAVFVGLLLQAALFGFGGLTTLGVDTVNMAAPGVILATLARPTMARAGLGRISLVAGGLAALAVAGTAGGVTLALALSSADYLPSTKVVLLTYAPLAVIEAVVTGFVVAFLARVKPEMLPFAPPLTEVPA